MATLLIKRVDRSNDVRRRRAATKAAALAYIWRTHRCSRLRSRSRRRRRRRLHRPHPHSQDDEKTLNVRIYLLRKHSKALADVQISGLLRNGLNNHFILKWTIFTVSSIFLISSYCQWRKTEVSMEVIIFKYLEVLSLWWMEAKANEQARALNERPPTAVNV